MGEMADDLELQEFELVNLPETHRRNGFGKYTYIHKGMKHWFKTLEDANKWAKKQGFRLSMKPVPKKGKS